jgi:N utilization substance protein B
MQQRRRAREFALQVLYGMDLQDRNVSEILDFFWSILENNEELGRQLPRDEGAKLFALQLVRGTWENVGQIDGIIRNYSEHWSVERMSRVDRSILRMAVYEILFCADIPPKVSLNEAIDLGKIYGSENSGAFINGILDAFYLDKLAEKP